MNHNWRVAPAHPNKDPVQPKSSLQIINANEGVEKKEHSYTVGRMWIGAAATEDSIEGP